MQQQTKAAQMQSAQQQRDGGMARRLWQIVSVSCAKCTAMDNHIAASGCMKQGNNTHSLCELGSGFNTSQHCESTYKLYPACKPDVAECGSGCTNVVCYWYTKVG